MTSHWKLCSGPHACCLDSKLLGLMLALPSNQTGQRVAAHTEGLLQLLYTSGECRDVCSQDHCHRGFFGYF